MSGFVCSFNDHVHQKLSILPAHFGLCMFSVAAMVGEIVHPIEEIITAKEVVLDPLVEIVQVHHQTEVKEDHTNALGTIVHFPEEKGELSRIHHPDILF